MSARKKDDNKRLVAFRRRLSRHYDDKPALPADARKLDGEELAMRRAELEARGLPPTKPPKVVPSFRGKKTLAIKQQTFFPAGREARKSKV